ncbi:hypothetical protein CONLIGDRAFT_680348 [Coniochaeta ligniaria NRRL 30616]|uniref:Uncharacterized protein n=1 Tax=Coniochaeta ligniaria NRRL 30616 TaxID=1408157 RepID=A0A1J7IPG1_9PEZI|nr:hypothetical protein CONLIGDRAFT_680348 [Coniochaeta ligniaria NRRL 30616]
MSTPTQITEPSEQEQQLYYYGLPSKPRLLARSNASESPWTPRTDDNNHPVGKSIDVVGSRHAMVARWHPEGLCDKAIALLEPVDWTSIDVIRIGYDGDEGPKPVIVWVGVAPGSTTWEVAHDAAVAVRGLLVREGMGDVHCEMRESIVSR